MTDLDKPKRSFPPGLGWMPIAAAGVVLALVSVFALVPTYTTKTVGAVNGNDPAAGGQQGSNSQIAGKVGTSTNGGAQGQLNVPIGGLQCAAGRNGGATAPGVTASEIRIATTSVTTGVGAGFLGEAVDGMQAAINQQNAVGGICGRRISLVSNNSGWDGPTGKTYIDNYITSGRYFALVGEPDSEGLAAAIDSGSIDRAQIPVVGSDGMLKDQYNNQWVWPVAASTVSNMHIIARYAHEKLGATSPKDFGIVFDTRYKFGPEGARALNEEVKRVTGSHNNIPGFADPPRGCNGQYCGISSDQGSYSTPITAFDGACTPCKVVVMLLEPKPMESWMQGEQNAPKWYGTLFGGEPLFDDNVGENCPGCANMIVWTGYRPAIQPFDAEKAVYTFCQSLKTAFPKDDCHNEFTEGAYLGTMMFIEAAKRVGPNLTRAALKQVLDGQVFNLGLSQPLSYGTTLPRVANYSMAAFQDNYSGSFNGWSYLGTGFIADLHPGLDL